MEEREIDVISFLEINEITLPRRLVNRILDKKFYNELKLYKYIEKLILEHTSNFLFPNHYIAFYPQVEEHKASKDTICNLSGSVIKKGEKYYCYHPLIENLDNNKIYTISKKVKASLGYQDKFPMTLSHYEEWYYKLKNAYYNQTDEIDFYLLSIECGDTAFEVMELKKNTSEHKMKLIRREIKKLEKLKLELVKNMHLLIDSKETELKIKKLDLRINKLTNNLIILHNETTKR